MLKAPESFNIKGIEHETVRCLSDAPWHDFHKKLDNHWYGVKRGEIPTDTPFIFVDDQEYDVIQSPQDFGVLTQERFDVLHELYWQYRMHHFNAVNVNLPGGERVPEEEWNHEVNYDGVETTALVMAESIIAKRKMEGVEIKLLLNLGV